MRSFVFLSVACALTGLGSALSQVPQTKTGGKADDEFVRMQHFSTVYNTWRQSMVRRNMVIWQDCTALSRQRYARNLAVSEKKKWPDALFTTPVNMPTLAGLKHVTSRIKGKTAASVWFGKINFGVGGDPKDNVLVLNFLFEGNAWKFDTARFYNLDFLPELREKLLQGDNTVVDQHDGLLPTGVVPEVAPLCPAPKYIAKVFVDCQGREVELLVNGISKHVFSDTRNAEIISGGLNDGEQRISFKVKDLPNLEKGYLNVSIFMMPEIQDCMPVRTYSYNLPKGKPIPVGDLNDQFGVTPEMVKKLKTVQTKK